jgi:hypothetical protein
MVSLGGEVLTNTQPFTQVMANAGWRRFQSLLASLGVHRLIGEVVVTGVPIVGASISPTAPDPGAQIQLNWTGCTDGYTTLTSPVIPQNVIKPLYLWERPTGSNAAFTDMDECLNGLPSVSKLPWNQNWEWRSDSIYMPGATQQTDIRIRAAVYLGDFVTSGMTSWYSQPIPIMRAMSPLAWLIAYELSLSRGGAAAATFDVNANKEIMEFFALDAQEPKAVAKTSEYGRQKDRFTPSKESSS